MYTTTPQYETVVGGGIPLKTELQDYQNYLAVKHRKKHTQKTYLNAIKQYLDHSNNNITQGTLNQFIQYLNQQYKPNTISTYIQGINLYLEYIHQPQLKTSTPSWQPIQRDTINREEIQEILNQAYHNNLFDYLVLRFVTDFDCRPHEITKSRYSNIKGDIIYFEDCKTGDTKGYIQTDLKKLLNHHKDHRVTPAPGYSDYIFLNQTGRYKGEKLSDNGWKIRDITKKYSNHVVGRELNPQDLRASVMTEEFNSYINPNVIQLKARHHSQKTTLRYNHAGEQETQHYVMDIGTIFKPQTRLSIGNRSHIKTLPDLNVVSLQDQNNSLSDREEDEGNYSFSFSITPSFLDFFDTSNSSVTLEVIT